MGHPYYAPPPEGLSRLDVEGGTLVIQATRLAHNAVVRVRRGKAVIVNADGTEFVIEARDPGLPVEQRGSLVRGFRLDRWAWKAMLRFGSW